MTHVWVLRVCDCNNWLVSKAGSNSLFCGGLEPVHSYSMFNSFQIFHQVVFDMLITSS